MKNVTEAARVILTTKLEWDRHPLTIPGRWGSCCAILGQLDRKTYVEVNAVLEAAGGVWNRKHRKHLFTVEVADAKAKVDGMLGTGKIVNEDKEAEFFPTPAPLAETMAVTAGIEPGMLVLEPSAGDGALVAAAVAMGAKVDACELLEKNRAILAERFKGCEVDIFEAPRFEDAPIVTPDGLGLYDRAILNPPFSLEVEQVERCMAALKPGGRLVAVMSAGIKFREGKHARLRAQLEATGGVIEDLPAGSFRASGTDVNTVLVVWDAPVHRNDPGAKATIARNKATEKAMAEAGPTPAPKSKGMRQTPLF